MPIPSKSSKGNAQKRRHQSDSTIDFPKLQKRSFKAFLEYYDSYKAVCKLMEAEGKQQKDVDNAIGRLRKSTEEIYKCDRLVDDYLLQNGISFPQAATASVSGSSLGNITCDPNSDESNRMGASWSRATENNDLAVIREGQERETFDGSGQAEVPTNIECAVENIIQWFVENKATKKCEKRYKDAVAILDGFLADANDELSRNGALINAQVIDAHHTFHHSAQNDAPTQHTSASSANASSKKRIVGGDMDYELAAKTNFEAIAETEDITGLDEGSVHDTLLTQRNEKISRSDIVKGHERAHDDGNEQPTSSTSGSENGFCVLNEKFEDVDDECAIKTVVEKSAKTENRQMNIELSHDSFLNEANANGNESETQVNVLIVGEDEDALPDADKNGPKGSASVGSNTLLKTEQNLQKEIDREHTTGTIIGNSVDNEEQRCPGTGLIGCAFSVKVDEKKARSEKPMIVGEDGATFCNAGRVKSTGCTFKTSNNDTHNNEHHFGTPVDMMSNNREVIKDAIEWEQGCMVWIPIHDTFLSEASGSADEVGSPRDVLIANEKDHRLDGEPIHCTFMSNEDEMCGDTVAAYVDIESTVEAPTESTANWEQENIGVAASIHRTFSIEEIEKTGRNEALMMPMSIQPIDTLSYEEARNDESTFCSFLNYGSGADTVGKKDDIGTSYISDEPVTKNVFENIVGCEEYVSVDDLIASIRPQNLRTDTEILSERIAEIKTELEHLRSLICIDLSAQMGTDVRSYDCCDFYQSMNRSQTMKSANPKDVLVAFALVRSKYESTKRKLNRTRSFCCKVMEDLRETKETDANLHEQIAELKGKLEQRDMEAMKQITESDQLKSRLDKANDSVETLQKQLAEQSDNVQRIQSELSTMKAAFNEVSMRNVEQSIKLKQAHVEIVAVRAQCAILREEREKLEKEVEVLKADSLNATHAYRDCMLRLESTMEMNKHLAQERDALIRERQTLFLNQYRQMNAMNRLQSPAMVPAGNTRPPYILIPGTNSSALPGTSASMMMMPHPVGQIAFTRFPHIQLASSTSSGIVPNPSATPPPLSSDKSSSRRRRKRNANTDGQRPQTTTSNDYCPPPTLQREAPLQHEDSPINVTDMSS